MRVISNNAISLDGRINTAEGLFTSLGSAKDHERMSLLRSQADAVLVGGKTFRAWPHPSLPEGEHLHQLKAPIWNVVVSRTLDVPLAADFLAEQRIRPLFLTGRSAPPGFPAEVVQCSECDSGTENIPIPWILDTLQKRGVETLLVEAGGELLFQFLAADAVDEIYVTLCPLIIGGQHSPSLAAGSGFSSTEMRRLKLISTEIEQDEIFLHYAVTRPGRS